MISSNHHQVASTPHLSPATTGAALLACERHPLALMTLRQLLGEVEELGINSRPISPKFLRILVDDQLFSVGIPKFWQIFHIVKRAPTGNFWVLFGVPLDQWDRGDPASDWAGEKLSSASAREVAGIPSGIAAFNYCFHLFLDILVSLPILCFRHEL